MESNSLIQNARKRAVSFEMNRTGATEAEAEKIVAVRLSEIGRDVSGFHADGNPSMIEFSNPLEANARTRREKVAAVVG